MEQEIKDKARRMAIDAASADPEMHKYTEAARTGGAWEPHDWVVNAIAKALKERTPVQIGRAVTDVITEIIDKRIEILTRRHEAAVDSICGRLRALEGTGDRTSSPARTSVVDVLNLCRDALVRITALEGGDITRAHGVRLDNLGADLTKAEAAIKNLRGGLEGQGMTLAEQNQRAIALHARVDALERGRTGRVFPPEDMEPILSSHAAKRHGLGFPRIGSPLTDDNKPPAELLVNGKPRAVVDRGGGMFSVQLQPEDLEGTRVVIGPAPERRGPPPGVPLDPTTLAIEGVRAELDGQRRRNTELTKERDDLNDRTRRLLDRADATQRELEAERALVTRTKDDHDRTMRKLGEATELLEQCARAAGMEELGSREANAQHIRERLAALGDSLKLYRDGKIVSEAGERKLYEQGRAIGLAEGKKDAEGLAIRERDEARRGYKCAVDERDALERQRDEAVRQRDQYGERNKANSAALTAAREALEMATRDRDRFNAGMSDANGRLAEVQAKAASRMRVISDQAEQITELREQLRVADGDRVPLAMDLENARADLKSAKESNGRAMTFVAAAQRAAQSFHEEPDPNLRELSGPLHKALCEMADASEVYETACSQAADDEDDDGFANAAANEGARIAAESRAEAENDPGT